MSSAFNKYSSAPSTGHYQQDYRQRIPQQQGVGQTLPPMPIGLEPHNTPPPPPGAMAPGTHVVVGRHTVTIQVFLAEGGFAHVYLVRMKEFPDPIVLKRIAVPDTERLKSVEKEIVFMRRLGSHKNIVRYFDSQVSPLPTGGFEALILMEYCPGGGVIDLMNRRLQQRLTEPEILKIFGDVSEALAYMHYCNPPALHRDLKVENILISASGRYKLCDFGSACLSKGAYVPQTLPEIQKLEDDIQRHTTLQYRAPEMIDIYQKRPINEKADIWALGVLLYKLCYYTTPFEEQGPLAILSAKFTFPTRPQFSDNTKNLISWLLCEDQDSRPNIYQVVEAVCKLSGKDCPIRNIYTNVSSKSSTPSQTSESSKRANDSIFEQRVLPKQETPNITPMRRGRPERKERDTTGTKSTDDSKENDGFDPFDPKSFSSHANSKQPALDFDPAKLFSLNESTSFTSKTDVSDADSRKSPLKTSVLNTIPTQSSAPQASTSGVEQSQVNSTKSGQYQRVLNSSTPDSFKSPRLDTQVRQLSGENQLLNSSLSGEQVNTTRQSSLGNRTVSPVKPGNDSIRDTKSAPGTPNTNFTAGISPVTSHNATSREEQELESRLHGRPTSKQINESDQKTEKISPKSVSGHLRNLSDPKMTAAHISKSASTTQKSPNSSSRGLSYGSNNQDGRLTSSKSSFSDLVPTFASNKEDTVESFNRKFPDLLSLDKQLSGSFESSKKADGSAVFRALDQAHQQQSKVSTNSTPPVRQPVLDRYQPQVDHADQLSKRPSVSSQEASNKGNYIQSKVMEQLQRFELANNERRNNSQSRRNSTKVSPPGQQKVDREEGGSHAASSPKTEAPIVSRWRRSVSQEGGESSPQPAVSGNQSEIAQMNRSIQSFRQMLQSPSPSPTDDGAKFNFEKLQSEKDDPTLVSQKSPRLNTPSPKSNPSDSNMGEQEARKKEEDFTVSSGVRQNPKPESPSPPAEALPVPQAQSGPYRPTPPPKPARFRMSAAMAPVLTPSSTTKASKMAPNLSESGSQGLRRPAQRVNREPSISDFESKFPSPEQLKQGLPKD
ncbi:hypothetical protein BGW37DRAFT_472004 [Umbelopsis sp. PMI_123]|nr:hypothetical protein BGW37DRAFT_472004 [Umbelopsis sp. PMI_123]